jgi:hypothetical protein
MGPDQKSKGLKGRPLGLTTWPTGHTLSRFRLRPGAMFIRQFIRVSHAQESMESRRRGHPTIHNLQTDSVKSVEAPLDLYIRILMVELTHATLFL